MLMNWLTPRAEARHTGPKGAGSFALEPIPVGTTVAAFGGFVQPREVMEHESPDRQSRSIQIDDDLFLISAAEPEPGDMINHSCDPSCGLVGAILVVTRRDIAVGEELTFDYAMSDGSDYDEFECHCGAGSCRGTVTGRDWQLRELQDRYEGLFSPYLARRIAARRDA
jgi:SET domain-containing protein